MEKSPNFQFALALLEVMHLKPLTQEEKLLIVKKFVQDNQLSSEVLFLSELESLDSHAIQQLEARLSQAVETLQSKQEKLLNAKRLLPQLKPLEQAVEQPISNQEVLTEETSSAKEKNTEVIAEKADTPPASPISEQPSEKDKAGPVSSSPKPPKGYSRNGIKLGRPRKIKTMDDFSMSDKKIILSTSSAKTSQPVKPQEQVNDKETTTVSPADSGSGAAASPSSTKISETQGANARIEALKYGKEFPIDMLYLVDKQYVRTNRLLTGDVGVAPVGVIVPYTYQHSRRELAVFFDDEHAFISFAAARGYAKHKIKPLGDKFWRVKSSLDDAWIKPLLATVNIMCKKMGGNEIKGTYYDGRDEYMSEYNVSNKIRYVCDVPSDDI